MLRIMRGLLAALLGSMLATSLAHTQEPKPPALTPEEQKLADQATALSREAGKSYQAGRYPEAIEKLRQALAIRQKLYPAEKYADGHPELADSLNNLGVVHQFMGQGEQALRYFEPSLAMKRKLYPESKYPDGHPDLALSLNNLGFVLHGMGQAEKALPYYEQSLAMKHKLYPESKYPDGHPDLALSLNNLGGALESMGQTEKALAYYEQSLTMNRKLYPVSKYPNGHPELAANLSNVGSALRALGRAEKALPYYEQSLEMTRRLYPESKYPDGHPHLARALNSMGYALEALGHQEQALDYYQRSLAMRRKLYPESKYPAGHPELARSLNNLAGALYRTGEAEEALSCHRQSVAMMRKLYPESKYPDGYPDFARTLSNLGAALLATGQAEESLTPLTQALQMQQKLLQRELVTASESAALDLIAELRLGTINFYYSAAVQFPATAADSYQAVWNAKGRVQRLLARRHFAASVQRQQAPEVRGQYESLGQVQREVGRLLNNPGNNLAARDQRLRELSDERDRLERALAKQLPALERDNELARLAPADLLAVLPAQTVLIDLIRYWHWENGKTVGGRYLAFVLAKGQPIQRVALGDASAIDRAIHEWRTAIAAGQASPAAERLRELVWAKLAPHLPAETTTVLLSPDGDLARLPWAALPIGKDRVLLEEYAVAQVPHAAFLLGQLKYAPQYEGDGSVLALGKVAYSSETWNDLPGTEVELKSLAARSPTALTGEDANSARVLAELPKARYAHFATHGFFDAEALTAEKKREAKAMQTRQFGEETRRVVTKNPLGFVGLVLANGEILTGLSILDLPLENLKLVTLSACETGLGEYTGGEGVQGLQWAFQLAGCPNVVASLWQVNDEATAALMRRFYYHLWEKHEPPIQALRLAQLELYHNPTQVADLVRGGAPRFSGVGRLTPKAEEPKASARAATKLWAAFVLSGVGR